MEEENGLRFQRFAHRRKRPVLWWIDKTCYERDWLETCLSHVPHYELQPASTLVPGAIIIANQLASHRSALERYETTQTPFYLIHLSDEYLDDDTSAYTFPHCQTVFRNYLSPLHLRNPKIIHFGIGYRDHFDVGVGVARRYAWSFAGYLKKSDRTLICNLFQVFTPHFIHETGGFNVGILNASDYAAIAHQSKFILCPVGNCSLDTFRFYEACEAGAVPVALFGNINQPYVRFLQNYWATLFGADDLPFLLSHSWEENVQKMGFYLNHPEAYIALQQRCHTFWTLYKRRLQDTFYQRLWSAASISSSA